MSEAEVARLASAVPHPLGGLRVEGDLVVGAVESVDCVGVLLDRAADRVQVLGSAVSLETYVWAYQRGVALHAPNTLVITAVHDHDATVTLLRTAYPPRYVRDELVPLLAKPRLPARISLDWPATALLLEGLRYTDAIENSGVAGARSGTEGRRGVWFDFEVNPS